MNQSKFFKIFLYSSENGSFKDFTPDNQERFWSVIVFMNPRRSTFMNWSSFMNMGENTLQEGFDNEQN